MMKSRILLACPDMGYMIPLQQKYINEFGDSVELEVITDGAYFAKLFSVHQHAQLLVVDEAFFSDDLDKHDIEKICVLVESKDAHIGDSIGTVVPIYKYTSLKDIFKQSCSNINLGQKDDSSSAETKVVLIHSASGGVGKTTLSIGLCTSLEQSGYSALYINAEWLQSFQWRLATQSAIDDSKIYAMLADEKEDRYRIVKHTVRKEDFSYLPPFKTSLMSQGLTKDVFKGIIEKVKSSGDYNFIIIDTDSVFDEYKTELMDLSNYVITMLTLTDSSIFATNKLVENIDGTNTEKYIFVCRQDPSLKVMNSTMFFTVGEYIENIPNCELKSNQDLGMVDGIRKIAYMIS